MIEFRFEPRLASRSLKSCFSAAASAGETGAGVDLLALPFEADEEEQLVVVLRVVVAEEERAAELPPGEL